MSDQERKREKIHVLLGAQCSQIFIAKQIGVNVSTVRRIQHARTSGKGPERAEGSGGHNRKRTHNFIEDLKIKIDSDPTTSMRRHAKEFQVDPKTIRKAVHQDLGLCSFVRQPRHLLTNALKQKRLDQCKKILSHLRHHGSTVKIFSDKKIFTVDQVYNRRNDRWLAESKSDVKGVFRTKHPTQVMVLGILGSDGQRMPPYFFGPNEKINTECYYKVLRYTVLPWLKVKYPQGNYVFQQDGAPAHMSAKVQKFCADNMAEYWAKTMWPPGSPDLNPLDFFWWGTIERKTNATPHPNLESLKRSIAQVWADESADGIRKACASFRPRIKAVIQAQGGHIE